MRKEHWKSVTLGSILPFKYGKNLPKNERSHSKEYNVISSAGIIDSHSVPLTSGASVVIGRKGSIGTTFFCANPVWPIDTTFYVERSDDIDIRFAYYLLRSLPLSTMNNDSAVPGLNRKQAEDITVEIPPLYEQQAIAATLGSLDDKIESNRRIINDSTMMAGLLFKAWFIDFAPFEGVKPSNWKEALFFDVATINYGKNLPTKQLLKNGYRVFGGNGQIGYYSEYQYGKERILISCRGAASGTVRLSRPFSFVTNNSLVVNEKDSYSYAYLKQWCLDRQFYDTVTGSAQPQVTIDSLKFISIMVPTQQVQTAFLNLLQPIYEKVESLTLENEKLVSLRNTLLPELLSGRICPHLSEEASV